MNNRMQRTLAAMAMMGTLIAAGCADTEIQGVVLNEDLNTPVLMVGLARGTNSEFADIHLATQYWWLLEAPTDKIASDGTTATEIRYAVGDFSNRPEQGLWGQVHEAIWAVFFTDERMKQVLPADDYASTPLLARNYIYGGHAERILGEVFCEIVYNYGKDGGILLSQPPTLYDATKTVPRDSAFKRAIFMHERALTFAEAGVAAGRAPAENDPLFDPQQLVHAANAGLAQSYLNLGEYQRAAEYARKVPDNFSDYVALHEEVDGGNNVAEFFQEGDDMSIYRTPAALLWPTDPRVGLSKCGDWNGANRDNSATVPPASAFINMSAQCGSDAGEFRSESNRYPLWVSKKYPDENADVELSSGAEMRLIEAEAALRAGNLGEFTTQVNRARAARGVAPITQPTSVGALEYPNAQNDAWSILDRERYLELFLEVRRLYDMSRWDHPFISGNHVLLPRLATQLPPSGRKDCLPIPQTECQVNPRLNCQVLTP